MTLANVRRHLRLVMSACLALAVLFVVAPPSANAATGDSLKLVGVDSRDSSNVQLVFRYNGASSDVSELSTTENGKPVQHEDPKPITDAGRTPGIVFVLDTSGSTDASGTLAGGRNAIESFLPSLAKGTQVALVSAGTDAILVQRFTTDQSLITKGLSTVGPLGEGGLWEGVARAVDEITNQDDMVGSIVLITDGNDNSKGASYSNAKGPAVGAGTAVYTIGVQDGNLNDEPRDLAESTGGEAAYTENAADVSKLLDGFGAEINGLYSITYASNSSKGVSDIDLAIGDVKASGSYIVGSNAAGPAALAFQPPASAGGFTSLQNDFGRDLAIVLAVLAAALAAYAIISIFVKDNTGLASVLRPYSDGYVTGGSDSEDDEATGETELAQTAVMQRAVEMTRQFAEKRGFLSWVESALERANLPLRAAEAIFFYLAAVIVLTLLAGVITQSFFVVLVALAIGALLPVATLNFLSSRRKSQFEAMLPDMLQLLSGTLRVGYSMMQGVEAVSQEVSEPMGRELRRVVTEARLGRPLEESLDAVAERMDSADFGWAVMAIRIQREVGGNLSELLMTVAETMTQRERLKRDVKSLTAEGRVSAYVLAFLPFALGFAMFVLNPDYMQALFDETIGKAMLVGGLLLMIGGFLWMQAIVKIDV